MSDIQLCNMFQELINFNFIPNNPVYFEIFNSNLNMNLKLDYLLYAFSVIDENNSQNFLTYKNIYGQNIGFLFNDINFIYNLLLFCLNTDLPNYFKYIINNKIIQLPEKTHNDLFHIAIRYKKQNFCKLITQIKILDKYDTRIFLPYEFI